jgi:hypothetical protein
MPLWLGIELPESLVGLSPVFHRPRENVADKGLGEERKS